MDKARLALNLRAARQGAGLSQQEAGEVVGKTRQTIINWENPESSPAPDDTEIRALAATYGVSPEQLVEGQIVRGAIVTGHEPTVHNVRVAENLRASEASSARLARNLPLRVREYLAELRLRLTKGGALEEEIEEAMDLLRSPALFTFYKGGTPSEFNEEDVLRGMKALAEGVVIPELRDRGRKIK